MVCLRVVVLTRNLELYALVAGALRKEGWTVHWQEGGGVPLADLEHLERARVWLWRTPWGLRAYTPERMAFLTRRDDPRTLAAGLRGQLGMGLLPGEVGVLRALGQGVAAEARALARFLGLSPYLARFHLKGLRNKFGLPLDDLLRLARHQVQVAGFEGHPEVLAWAQVEPFLHVPGQEQGQGYGPQEAAPVGQALGVQAL